MEGQKILITGTAGQIALPMTRHFDSAKRISMTGGCTIWWQDGIDDMVAAWDPEHGARMIARLMGEG